MSTWLSNTDFMQAVANSFQNRSNMDGGDGESLFAPMPTDSDTRNKVEPILPQPITDKLCQMSGDIKFFQDVLTGANELSIHQSHTFQAALRNISDSSIQLQDLLIVNELARRPPPQPRPMWANYATANDLQHLQSDMATSRTEIESRQDSTDRQVVDMGSQLSRFRRDTIETTCSIEVNHDNLEMDVRRIEERLRVPPTAGSVKRLKRKIDALEHNLDSGLEDVRHVRRCNRRVGIDMAKVQADVAGVNCRIDGAQNDIRALSGEADDTRDQLSRYRDANRIMCQEMAAMKTQFKALTEEFKYQSKLLNRVLDYEEVLDNGHHTTTPSDDNQGLLLD